MSTVDATGTRRRLQALAAIGWTRTALARELRTSQNQVRALLLSRTQVTEATREAVRALYDRAWNQWPAGVGADRTRRHAQGLGWAVPMAWDDDHLDDPAASPAPGWRRNPRAKRPKADLAEDGRFIMATQRCTRQQAAERIGVDRMALDVALARCARVGEDREAS